MLIRIHTEFPNEPRVDATKPAVPSVGEISPDEVSQEVPPADHRHGNRGG